MAKPFRIQVKKLKELQQAMKRGETALEPRHVRPILLEAVTLIKDEAYRILKSVTKRSVDLPPGWEHIEDALVAVPGKSSKIASAFAKVFRRQAPQAIWIEFSHRVVGHRPKLTDTGKRVAARPFFRPAVVNKRKDSRRVVRIGLQKLLQESIGFGKPGTARD